MKGLFSAILSIIIGDNVSFIIIRFSLIFVSFFILLNLLTNGIVFTKKTDKILFFIGLIGCVAGIAQRDFSLLYNTVLLFGLPVLFNQFRKISDNYFFKITFVFFFISTLYMLIENILFNPRLYGLDLAPLSREQISGYTHLFFASSAKEANILDLRHLTGYVRTSGYLGHFLAMPVLLALGATFFYVLAREKQKLINNILAIVSAYLLLVSLSTTATISFFLSVIFYETFVRRSYISLFVVLLFIIGIFTYISYSKTGIYLFQRQITLLNEPTYYKTFFDYSGLARPINLLYLFLGKWNWKTPPGISSHIDLILIPLTFGGFVSFLLYRRMLNPLIIVRKSDNELGRLFALPVLTAFICLYHHYMTLNINIMFVVTVFIVKANDFSARLKNKPKLHFSD